MTYKSNVQKFSFFSNILYSPINSKHWKVPSKLYYQGPTVPDLLLEERSENNFNVFIKIIKNTWAFYNYNLSNFLDFF